MNFVGDNLTALAGLFAALIALCAWLGDRRRARRTDLDRVGLMPWQGVAFWASLAAAVLWAAAFEQWLGR